MFSKIIERRKKMQENLILFDISKKYKIYVSYIQAVNMSHVKTKIKSIDFEPKENIYSKEEILDIIDKNIENCLKLSNLPKKRDYIILGINILSENDYQENIEKIFKNISYNFGLG